MALGDAPLARGRGRHDGLRAGTGHHPSGYGEVMTSPCVAAVPIFSELDAAEQTLVAARLVHRRLQDGEVAEFPGDVPALRVVHSGRLRQSRVTEAGGEQLLRVLGPGDFTGEAAVASGRPVQHLSAAMGPTRVCELSAAQLHEVLEEHPSVARHMLAGVSLRLLRAEARLTHITGSSVGRRLGQYLAALASRVEPGEEFALPLAKKDLASFLGTTPETVSRRLRAWEDAGVITQASRGRMTVLDPAALDREV